MKKFVFLRSQSINRTINESRIDKYTKSIGFFDIIKIIGLSSVIIISLVTYLYYVNLVSTRGYFLREENQNLNTLSFKNDILITKVLKSQKTNRDELHEAKNNLDRIEIIKTQIVKIPIDGEKFAKN